MSKTARVNFNLPSEKKAEFEAAAKMMGLTLTEFAVNAMSSLRKKIVTDNHMIELSMSNQRKFIDGLLNPKEPNKALRNALDHYNKVIGDK